MKKGLYLLVGSLALVAGIVGVVLPLVPTTPFLLLSSYCFVRSSPAAHRWLLNHPWLGIYLRDWENHRGVRRSVKVLAVISVAAMLAIAWLVRPDSTTIKVVTTVLASIGLLVVWRLPVVSTSTQSAPSAVIPSSSATENWTAQNRKTA